MLVPESGIYKAWTKGFPAERCCCCNPVNNCIHFTCQLFKLDTPDLDVFFLEGIKFKRKYDSQTILVNTFLSRREQGLQCNFDGFY